MYVLTASLSNICGAPTLPRPRFFQRRTIADFNVSTAIKRNVAAAALLSDVKPTNDISDITYSSVLVASHWSNASWACFIVEGGDDPSVMHCNADWIFAYSSDGDDEAMVIGY